MKGKRKIKKKEINYMSMKRKLAIIISGFFILGGALANYPIVYYPIITMILIIVLGEDGISEWIIKGVKNKNNHL